MRRSLLSEPVFNPECVKLTHPLTMNNRKEKKVSAWATSIWREETSRNSLAISLLTKENKVRAPELWITNIYSNIQYRMIDHFSLHPLTHRENNGDWIDRIDTLTATFPGRQIHQKNVTNNPPWKSQRTSPLHPSPCPPFFLLLKRILFTLQLILFNDLTNIIKCMKTVWSFVKSY